MVRSPSLASLALVVIACGAPPAPPDASDPGSDAGPPPELPSCAGAVEGAGSLAEALGNGEVRAGRITEPGELLGGDSADGRIGDFKLYNARVAFVVQAAREGDNLVPYGGAVVDADLVRAPGEWGEDRIDELVTALFVRPLGVRPFAADEVCVIADGSDGGPAIVRAVGTDGDLPITRAVGITTEPLGLSIVQDFVLAPDADHVEIVTTLLSSDGFRLGVGDFILMSDDGVDPFSVGAGFDRTRQGAQSSLSMVGSAGEDQHLVFAIFGDAPWTPDRVVAPLLRGLGGDDITIFFPLRDVVAAANELRTVSRYVGVARDVDALNRARHARQGVGVLGEVAGRVTAAGAPVDGARVHVLDTSTDPVSWVSMGRSSAGGAFRVEVPAGSYRLVATGRDIGQDVEIPLRPTPDPSAPFAHGYATSAPVEVEVAAGESADATLELGAPATLRARLVDDSTGDLVAGKVIVAFPGGTDPTPPDALFGERNPYGFADHVLWTTDGAVEATLEPGSYSLVGAYGIEWETASLDVVLAAGETSEVELRLARSVDRAGWLAGDMHMHGGPSIHGEATREMRVVTNIAEGLDYFVASDHDRVIDYGPSIDALGVGDRLAVILSDEISGVGTFHANPYPLTPRADEPNGGATPWWDIAAPCDQFAYARERGAALVQINHGWGSGGYFSNYDFDWLTGTAGASYCNEFDAMETFNGSLVEELLLVYAGLLNAGHVVTPTGVSDSHHRIPEAGMGRTYLRSGVDAAGLSDEAFVVAMRAHSTIVTTGPFIELIVSDGARSAGPGETLSAASASLTVTVRVLAPSWIEIESVRLYGSEACPDAAGACSPLMTWPASPAAPGVWLEEIDVPITVAGDTWLYARADGSRDMAPVYPGHRPFAHTAAVLVDVP